MQFTNQPPTGSLQPQPTSAESASVGTASPSPPTLRRDRTKPHPLLARIEQQNKTASLQQQQQTNGRSVSTSGPTAVSTASKGSGIPSTSRLLSLTNASSASVSKSAVPSTVATFSGANPNTAFVSTSKSSLTGVTASIQAKSLGMPPTTTSASRPVTMRSGTSNISTTSTSKPSDPSSQSNPTFSAKVEGTLSQPSPPPKITHQTSPSIDGIPESSLMTMNFSMPSSVHTTGDQSVVEEEELNMNDLSGESDDNVEENLEGQSVLYTIVW